MSVSGREQRICDVQNVSCEEKIGSKTLTGDYKDSTKTLSESPNIK